MDPIQFIHEKTNLALKITNALGYNIPPAFLLGKSVVPDAGLLLPDYDGTLFNEKYKEYYDDTLFLVPVSLKLLSESDNQYWQLPLDPLVSISGKNIIGRRYVAKSKMRGSIKETWSQDDYEISIAGLLMGEITLKEDGVVSKLKKYLEASEPSSIKCDLLNNVFEIYTIAIESYDFPFTKGMENQAFTIKAYSDDNYQLLEGN